MSDMTTESELAQVHLLTHAVRMGGYLSASYFDYSDSRTNALTCLLLADPPLFEFVDDPDCVPHQRFHLTPVGVDVASQLEWVDG